MGSAGRGGSANAPGSNDVLNVGKCAVATASEAYVQAGDTPLFLQVRDGLQRIAIAARDPAVDVFVLPRTLSSDVTKLLAKVVHADDKTREPRLGYPTEGPPGKTPAALPSPRGSYWGLFLGSGRAPGGYSRTQNNPNSDRGTAGKPGESRGGSKNNAKQQQGHQYSSWACS